MLVLGKTNEIVQWNLSERECLVLVWNVSACPCGVWCGVCEKGSCEFA